MIPARALPEETTENGGYVDEPLGLPRRGTVGTLMEVQVLDPAELERLRQRAYTRLRQAGAHYVVDSLAEVLPCLDDIEARIVRGERP
jgi:hypothetical protein